MLNDLFAKIFSADERFVMHQYYSTRWALIIGAILMGAWVVFDYLVNQIVHFDFILIMAVMAVTKIVLMVYYRLTQ